ncbi:MAG: ABC transporter ATP-binding protein/permease [bacterium]|nr:ABC transporter ATP-binding protein/permease [bacterium]
MTTARPKRRTTPFDVLRFAAGYWRRQPGRLTVIFALLGAAVLFETNLPRVLSAFFEAIRLGLGTDAILYALLVFLLYYFAYTILFNTMYLVYNVFETKNFNSLLNDAFIHVESLSEHFFVNAFTGSIITKIKRARDKMETFEDQVLIRLLPTFTVVLLSIIFLAFRFPALAALLSVYVVVVMIVSVVMVLRYAGPAQEEYVNAEDAFGAHLADSVGGIATTKSYAQEIREIGRFAVTTESLRKKNLRAYLRSNITAFMQQILLGGMLALLLGGGTWYFLNDLATIGDMAYLILAYTIMQSYIREIGENIKNLLTASYDLHAVIALMREKPHVADRAGAKALEVHAGGINLENVSFVYPGKETPALENLSVAIKPGERVALVGHSGSGKTTFVRLVQRLYDLQNGRVTIDGQDIAGVTQLSLRSAIALVPQDPILFHRSIRDNIAYGRPEATTEEVREAAAKANIDDFIMTLPRQYETLVGERGIKLSGGERQRVAIARAILTRRPILILDEATSSLDSSSERAVQDAIHTLTHGQTSIMIAHRLSTIRDADRILVFDGGKIVEEGTHDELVHKTGGVYAGFFALQSGGFVRD